MRNGKKRKAIFLQVFFESFSRLQTKEHYASRLSPLSTRKFRRYRFHRCGQVPMKTEAENKRGGTSPLRLLAKEAQIQDY
jgi:hypothetical protein